MASKKKEKQKRKDALKRAKKAAKEVKRARREAEKEKLREIEERKMSWTEDPRELLRVPGDFNISEFKRDATPGWEAGKKPGKKYRKERGKLMAELQERLFAQAQNGAQDAALVVVQGMDTAGKGGIARHVLSMVDPQGVHLKSFKAPTEEERNQHFLDRIRKELPQPGMIGMFDRSHYEDILVPTAQARAGHTDDQGVSWIVAEDELNSRYHDIYEMEVEATKRGIRVIKLCLLVSYEEQGKRLMDRLMRPDKHWKYSPHDLDVRAQWNAYQDTYEEVLRRTSTEIAPWYVIPADHKWYARLVATEIISRTLAEIDPQWPEADFDVEVQKARLGLSLTDEALARYGHEHVDKLVKAAVDDEEVQIEVEAIQNGDE